MSHPNEVRIPEKYATRRVPIKIGHRPQIVAIVGTPYEDEILLTVIRDETRAGKIVLSEGTTHDAIEEMACTPEEALALDNIQMHRIDLADEVLVLNATSCITEKMAREIAYAIRRKKAIRLQTDLQVMIDAMLDALRRYGYVEAAEAFNPFA